MSQRISGKVAIVTGAAGGLGLAMAQRFAQEGAAVVLADILDEPVRAAAQGITDTGGRALAFSGDVGYAEVVDRLFASTLEAFGTVDILVNNAANTGNQRHMFTGDEKWWDDFIRTNLKSQYLCLDRAARIMAKRGGGAIVNISSGGATRAHRGYVAYDASKGGIEALTRSAAVELAPYGVRVNAIVPGLFSSNPQESPDSRRRRDETVPLGWGGRPEDIAGPALFLVSDDARYVTGACLTVDGGVLVQQRSPQVDTLRPSDFPTVDQIDDPR